MQKDAKILLADDDPSLRLVLEEALKRDGHAVVLAASIAETLACLDDADIKILVSDVMFPDGNALEKLAKIRTKRPDIAIAVMSAQSTLLTAVKTIEYKVEAYLPKPFPLRELIGVVARLNDRAQTPAPPAIAPTDDTPAIIGKSRAMQEIYRNIARLMPTDLTVMISGESGSGKEVVARAIHDLGKRRDAPFVAINMAAIPQELIESELFGYEKGAFTGADRQNLGRFEQASGGTLFLDEIGDMPLNAQTRLLRVLQDGTFTRLGGRKMISANCRIIAATHKDLAQAIKDGEFRHDLFYRLNVVPLQLPPLRARAEDIPDLIENIMRRAQKDGLESKIITDEAMQLLKRHAWPGNVRELENTIKRLLVLVDGGKIETAHLDDILSPHQPSTLGGASHLAELIANQMEQFFAAHNGALPPNGIYERILAEVERPLLTRTLSATKGNQLKAAEVLGINRNTLRKKITALGIDPKSERDWNQPS